MSPYIQVCQCCESPGSFVSLLDRLFQYQLENKILCYIYSAIPCRLSQTYKSIGYLLAIKFAQHEIGKQREVGEKK